MIIRVTDDCVVCCLTKLYTSSQLLHNWAICENICLYLSPHTQCTWHLFFLVLLYKSIMWTLQQATSIDRLQSPGKRAKSLVAISNIAVNLSIFSQRSLCLLNWDSARSFQPQTSSTVALYVVIVAFQSVEIKCCLSLCWAVLNTIAVQHAG
jgi:hypothetical protein